MSEFEQENEGVESTTALRLPGILDVFLYPVNVSGLTMFCLFVFVPLVLTLIGSALSAIGLGIVMLPLGLLFILINWILRFYLFWYLGYCIRDSAEGQHRTPDTLSPDFDDGLGETVRQTLMIVGVVAICFLPVTWYYLARGEADATFWAILGGGGFFLPMALLSVVMQDGLWGLNPFRIVISILRTFGWYLCVVAAFWVPIGIIACFVIYFFKHGNALTYVGCRVAYVYLLLVASHVLGRFYYRQEERLRWF